MAFPEKINFPFWGKSYGALFLLVKNIEAVLQSHACFICLCHRGLSDKTLENTVQFMKKAPDVPNGYQGLLFVSQPIQARLATAV